MKPLVLIMQWNDLIEVRLCVYTQIFVLDVKSRDKLLISLAAMLRNGVPFPVEAPISTDFKVMVFISKREMSLAPEL